MTKFTDTLKAALEKKHAAAHPDAKIDGGEINPKTKKSPAMISGKPTKKIAGRGR